MSPESFNSAVATRKLEAIDILLIQAKRGSDADRIRAASAILRIAFIPILASTVASASSRCAAKPPPSSPSLREGAGGRVQEATNNPAAPDRPSAVSSPLPLPGGAGERTGEGVTTPDPQTSGAFDQPPVCTPDSPDHRGGLTGSPSHASTPPINFTTPPHTSADPLPMHPSHAAAFPPRGLIITADPQNTHPFPPQTPMSLGIPIITYEHQHQFSSA